MSVYFAVVGQHVKVGYSANPIKRTQVTSIDRTIKPLDLEHGGTVELLGWIPGDRRIEQAVHARLGAHWVAGEWYTDCPEVRAVLHSHDEAVVPAELSAKALVAIVRHDVHVHDAAAMWPVNDRPVEDIVLTREASA